MSAPPIGSTADARILSDLCDYVVVIVPYGMATKEQIRTAIDSIAPDKLIGLIFNN